MNHYQYASLTAKDIARFNRSYTVNDSCWIWQKHKTKPAGYGSFAPGKELNHRSAHRWSWIIHNKQDWPASLEARHTCHNPSCVNPNHILPGTRKENDADRKALGRQAAANRKKAQQPGYSDKMRICGAKGAQKARETVIKPVRVNGKEYPALIVAIANSGYSYHLIHKYIRENRPGFEFLPKP